MAYLEGGRGDRGPPIGHRPKKLLLCLSSLILERIHQNCTASTKSRQQRSMRRCSTTLCRSSTASIFCGVSSGQRLQQNSARTLPRQHSSVKFPNVYRLLSILGTLPVTTCESERVFSKLQRTRTSIRIRSTMTEDRLDALLLLQCHREHCPTPDDVLSAFAHIGLYRPGYVKPYVSLAVPLAFKCLMDRGSRFNKFSKFNRLRKFLII